MDFRIDVMNPSDALALDRDIRPADAAELAAAGLTAVTALESANGWAAWDGDTLLAVFGVQPMPDAEAVGVPWMLCTNQLRRLSRRHVLLLSQNFVVAAQREFRRLQNFVHRHNAQAVGLVRWLGFTVDTEPTGPGGNFYLFHWSESDV